MRFLSMRQHLLDSHMQEKRNSAHIILVCDHEIWTHTIADALQKLIRMRYRSFVFSEREAWNKTKKNAKTIRAQNDAQTYEHAVHNSRCGKRTEKKINVISLVEQNDNKKKAQQTASTKKKNKTAVCSVLYNNKNPLKLQTHRSVLQSNRWT